MLLVDRFLGGNFFNTQSGGSAVLWQHFFWIFGHPEVYILIFPAFAIFGGDPHLLSKAHFREACHGGRGRLHRLHQPRRVGAPYVRGGYDFVVKHLLYGFHYAGGIPTGIKIFNWTATMYGGKLRLATPMLFCCAFLFQFLIAGLTGIMLATGPFDWQLHDSYFVVGHFHFTLVAGLVFGLFAGMYYWFPKVSGRMYNETLAKWHFWLFTIGVELTFVPMHFLGFLGMPRRIYTYAPDRGWDFWNLVATSGLLFQIPATLIFVWNMVHSAIKGEVAGDDPWDAWTLEWTTTSPPPEYNFETLPEVRSSRPLWDIKNPNDPDWRFE